MSDRRFGWFTFLTDCPHCGQPLPLNIPTQETSCASCLKEVTIPNALWKSVIREFDDKHDENNSKDVHRGSVSIHGFRVRYEYALAVPQCEKCDSEYPVDPLQTGPARNFSCVACGDPASTAPTPKWLKHCVSTITRIYSVDPGVALGSQAGSSPALSDHKEAIRPISMSCPQCAGGLQVTTKSDRILSCKYCDSDIYLPDTLWRRLHPAKTVQRFFVSFEGLSRAQKARKQYEAEQQRAKDYEKKKKTARKEQKRQARENRTEKAKEKHAYGLRLTASAWKATNVTIGVLILCILWAWQSQALFSMSIDGNSGIVVTFLLGIIAVVSVLVAMHKVGKPIQHVTNNDFSWMLFITWFWLFFVFIPMVGTLIGLWRAYATYAGRFSASTITTNGSSSSYPAVTLKHGEGRPGGILFLALAFFLPLLGLVLGVRLY